VSAAASSFDGDRLTLCLSLTQARTVDIPMIAATVGFDALYVDLEHSVTSLETASMLCAAGAAVGLTPYVRVPSLDFGLITRVLDGGARGVIAPHVDTPEQAQQVVDACRFPPRGRRTVYGATPTTGYRHMPAAEVVQYLDDHTFVAVMVESVEAVQRADAIAAVDGVDTVLVGPHDLSADMGIPGQFRHERFAAAMETIAQACEAGEAVFGVAGISDVGLLGDYVRLGVRFVSAGTDAGLFQAAAQARVTELRGVPIPGGSNTP
jgi:4-hydroxy-2-oxoheptanedioate aldolase